MTLRQTLQKSTASTNELFTKLINTSDQAVKTRESMFADLNRDLRVYVDLEEEHLLPVLRKHQETKALVPDITKSHKELLAALDELAVLPKGDTSFVPRLTNIRKQVQQHLRDERQELLPAVEKALNDDEAEALASKLDAGAVKADKEHRIELEERRLAAKLERERANAMAKGQEALGKAVEQGVKSAGDTTQKIVAGATDAVSRGGRRVAQGAEETLTTYREMAREGGEDIKAVATAVKTLADAGAEARTLWLKSLARAGRNSLRTSFLLVRHPLHVVQTEREFVAEASRNLLETTTGLLEIARRASGEAVRPVQRRLQAN